MPITRMSEHPSVLNALFYSFTGVGKTVLVTTALDSEMFCPALFVDADKGTLSVRKYKDHPGLYYWSLGEYRELNDVFEACIDIEAYRKKHPLEALPDEPFKTVIIDDIVEVYFKGLKMVIAEDKARYHPDRDELQPQLQDYGKARLLIHKLCRSFRDLPQHFLATCQAGQIQDGQTGRLQVGLQMIGKLTDELPVFFDIVGYLMIAQADDSADARRLLLQPTRVLRAKNRATPASLEYIDHPTIAKLIQQCPHLGNNTQEV